MADVSQEQLLRLLDLQAEDTAIRRLAERRAGLPEAVRLQETNERLAELEADLEIARKQHEEVEREHKRLEDEIATLDQKTEKEEQRLFSGAVSNPKELGSLQAEVASLKKRKSSLEDDLLEVMVQREQTGETFHRLTSERDATAAEAQELGGTVARLTKEIDEETRTHEQRRSEVVPDIPQTLLSLYERLREQKAGIGAAALEQGTCQGCHTKLPAREFERVRSEGGLQRCENCRRILVVV